MKRERRAPLVGFCFGATLVSSRGAFRYQHHCRKGRFFAPRGGGPPLFSLEAPDAAVRSATVLEAPCAPSDFHAFVTAPGGADSRVVTWGYYAKQLEDIRNLGFADDRLFVVFSETAMEDASALLDFTTRWLGLPPFDFARLDTFTDALGRDQLRAPGLLGWASAFYAAHNYRMVRRHTAQPILPDTRAFLDDHYRSHNRQLELDLNRAPRVAVYPTRKAGAPLLPSKWST